MFKVNNKDTVCVFIVNFEHGTYGVFIVNFEQVNADWVDLLRELNLSVNSVN